MNTRLLTLCFATLLVLSTCKKKEDNTPAQTLTWEYVAAWGAGGTGDGQFDLMTGLAVDKDGNQYISDINQNRVQKLGPNGAFITKWGSTGSAPGQFNWPREIEVTADGIEVADQDNCRFQTFSTTGTYIYEFGTCGNTNGLFNTTSAFDVDASGNLYATDPLNYRVQKFNPARAFVLNWSLSSWLGYAGNIRCASNGDIFVSFSVEQVSPVRRTSTIVHYNNTGTLQNSWEVKFADTTITYIASMDFDSQDNLHIAGSDCVICIYKKDGTFIKQWGKQGAGPGEILSISTLRFGPNDDLYIAGCKGNKNCRVSKFTRKN